MNMNSYLTLHSKINCTSIIMLTAKFKTTKLPEEAEVEKSFLDRTQETWTVKKNIDNFSFTKKKDPVLLKMPFKKKINEKASRRLYHRGLISRICKELLQFNNLKTNNSIQKWTNDSTTYLTEEDRQMANKYMKKCWCHLSLGKWKLKPLWATTTYLWGHGK